MEMWEGRSASRFVATGLMFPAPFHIELSMWSALDMDAPQVTRTRPGFRYLGMDAPCTT